MALVVVMEIKEIIKLSCKSYVLYIFLFDYKSEIPKGVESGLF